MFTIEERRRRSPFGASLSDFYSALNLKMEKSKNNLPSTAFRKGNIPWNKLNLDKNLIIQMYKKDIPATKIGKMMGCGYSPIYRILKENGEKVKEYGYYSIRKSPWNKDLTAQTDERVRKNIENTKKTKNSLAWKETIGKDTIKKSSETLKKLYESGKITVWNKNLTAKDDDRIRDLGIKVSKTRKKLFATGSLVPPLKDKKMPEEFCKMMSIKLKRLFREGKIKINDKQRKAASKQMKKNRQNLEFNKKLFKSWSIPVTKPHKKVQEWIKEHTSLITETNAVFRFGKATGSIDEANYEKKIAIYIDGNYWHNYPNGRRWDEFCSTYLRNKGWNVLRFWESDINKHSQTVIQQLKNIKY